MGFRTVYLLGFLSCLSMLAIAGYFQFVEHLEPCPLCILQRVAVLGAGILFLLGAVQNPKYYGRRVYGFLTLIVAGVGAAISGRHVWIQNLPADQVPSCGPGLSFIMENFPLTEALNMVLNGSGECADVLWTFLGLSIPGWTLVAFSLMGLVGLFYLFARTASPRYF